MKRSGKKIELSETFAEQLLQCQIQYKMSSHPSQTVIRKLLQLYAIGVEYYESIKSRKFIYFQQKMKQIFKDIEKMSKYSTKTNQNEQQQNINICATKTPSNKKFSNFLEIRDHKLDKLSNMDLIKRIINESSLKNIETEIILQKQLQMQDQRLRQKLQRRKQKTMQKCLSETSAGLSNDMSSRSSIDIQSHIINLNLKPLVASFADVIAENEFDDQDIDKGKNKLKSEFKLQAEFEI